MIDVTIDPRVMPDWEMRTRLENLFAGELSIRFQRDPDVQTLIDKAVATDLNLMLYGVAEGRGE